MKTDRYTKIVLTVIAACLVWIAIGGPSLVAAVEAQGAGSDRTQRVYIAGYVDWAGQPRNFDSMQGTPGALPVVVVNK